MRFFFRENHICFIRVYFNDRYCECVFDGVTRKQVKLEKFMFTQQILVRSYPLIFEKFPHILFS